MIGEPCGDMLDRFFARDQSYRTIGDELELPGRHDCKPHFALSREIEGRDGRFRGSRQS